MALPTNRTEFIDYIKTALGDPVIRINVSPEQFEDRVDEAISMFQQYHGDGSLRTFLSHKIAASNLNFASAVSGSFSNNSTITGSTSGATGKVFQQTSNTQVQFTYPSSNLTQFEAGETVVGSDGATGVLSSNTSLAVQLGDFDQRSIPVANNILSITRIIAPGGLIYTRGDQLFNPFYQFVMSDLGALSGTNWLTGGGVTSYYITKSHLEMLHDLFVGDVLIRFNRYRNRLFLDIDWQTKILPGQYIVAEAYVALDPDDYTEIWKDIFLRKYATALVKKQWGINLSKYEGVQMPGGLSLNATKILDEATREVDQLEKELQDKWATPPMFYVG